MNLTSNNPAKVERNVSIAHERLQGATYNELAEKFDVSTGTISRVLNDSEIRDIIETGTKQLVSMVPKAIDNYRSFLTDSESEHHYKASKDALQATGIFPSHAQNLTINNILNVNAAPDTQQIQRISELIQARHEADIEAEYTIVNDVDSEPGQDEDI